MVGAIAMSRRKLPGRLPIRGRSDGAIHKRVSELGVSCPKYGREWRGAMEI